MIGFGQFTSGRGNPNRPPLCANGSPPPISLEFAKVKSAQGPGFEMFIVSSMLLERGIVQRYKCTVDWSVLSN